MPAIVFAVDSTAGGARQRFENGVGVVREDGRTYEATNLFPSLKGRG